MSNADKIRACLTVDTPKYASDIVEETGIPLNPVCSALTAMSRRGEFIRHGDRPHGYTINPDYKPASRWHGEVVDRSKLDRPSVTRKALQQLVASGRMLRNVVRANVEGYEANDDIVAALEMQERAEELARAVVA